MTATLFLLVGLPAAGKTTAARLLSHDGALRFTPDEWMIPLFGESNPGAKRDVLEGRFLSIALEALRIGVDSVLDFGFWGRDERFALMAIAAALGGRAEVRYFPIDAETQSQRVAARWSSAPLETFALSPADLVEYREIFEEPDDAELAGRYPSSPPDGAGSWATWAESRWPSLVVPTSSPRATPPRPPTRPSNP